MINHARTLLLNTNGASRPLPTYYLEEYVDPQFQALNLPSFLANTRAVLLGRDADAAFANYRLWELLRTVDSTEYAHFVTDLDPRVTYRRKRSVATVGRSVSYTPITSNTSRQLAFIGEIGAGVLSQRLQYNWTVTQLSPTSIGITQLQTQQSDTQIFSYTDGLSSIIPLIGSTLGFRFYQSGTSVNGSVWTIEAFTEPQEDLSELPDKLAQLGDAVFFELFPNRDPYLLFKDLWNKSVYFQDRLTGIVLAYAYRAEEVRTNNG